MNWQNNCLLCAEVPSIHEYATATLHQILTPEQEKKAQNVYAYNLASCVFENTGKGFIVKLLPQNAQFSSVKGIIIKDWDGDGKKDLLLHGNDFRGVRNLAISMRLMA
jgi:hypothetical protein